MKYICWRDGRILSDVILENIISAAKRGLMTEEGKKLILVPDRRYGEPDEFGLKSMKSVKKWECETLGERYLAIAKMTNLGVGT